MSKSQPSATDSPKVIIAEPEQAATAAKQVESEPIVIDLGKKKKKDVRKLRRGKSGRLINRVEDTIEQLRENGALAKDAQPVVIVIRKKSRKKGRRFTKMWGLG